MFKQKKFMTNDTDAKWW